MVPIRLAFTEGEDPIEWIVAYAFVDLSFLFDIILTFFSSFTDSNTSLEVTCHKRIAISYLKLWFWFDILSIIPIDLFLTNQDSG